MSDVFLLRHPLKLKLVATRNESLGTEEEKKKPATPRLFSPPEGFPFWWDGVLLYWDRKARRWGKGVGAV
ncbi:hypothetical protein MLD38_032595 [Melastoma candidum]|uniref:Uncharacterized protein n=1 Tax=Melastoma candidum TaxID=119954 RepID=A0ACB9M467_9MYRT|nr:hypothetical protein MLD38_032595 [Melastoma candidum]